jgi:hypothetical protein
VIKNILPLLILTITIACGTAEAKKKSASTSSSCSSKLKGNWEFGRAPFGCKISASISDPLEQKYSDLTFDDGKSRKEESSRFTNDMHGFLMDYSTAYFQRRSPEATAQTVAEWNHLVLSMIHQESFWTHFRKGKDGVFRYFKGDSGHGFGLAQVDNRWHKKFINSGKVYDPGENLVYALDILFDGRAKALKKPCTKSRDAASISRSAYSAFNGGPSAKCRWTKPKHKWARNDKNFYSKYKDKAWEKVVKL